MAEIYYSTDLYSDDEVKDKYISAVKGTDSRVIDRGFVDHISQRARLTVKKKCYMTVNLTCNKDVTVHYSAHKKTDETTGFTITKRTDAMGIDDYKVSENTKKVTYTDSGDYSKSFYNVSESVTICVDENFSYNAELPKRAGETKEMPAVYGSVEPYTGITSEMMNKLTSSSGCYLEIDKCRDDINESARRTDYTLDSCTLKKATITNVNVESVKFYVKYTVSFMYKRKSYKCELCHDSSDNSLSISGNLDFPRSQELENKYNRAIMQGKQNKDKGKRVTVPTIIIGIIGIIMSFAFVFRGGFSEGFPFVIASLVLNIWYMWWVSARLFKDIDDKLKKITEQFNAGKYIDNVKIPEVNMSPLVIKSLLLTAFNLIFILIALFPELY